MVGGSMSRITKQMSLAMILGTALVTASAQKPSVWNKIKDAAKAEQQKTQQPGQQPAQRPDKRGQSSQNQANDSGPIKPPAGTKVEETLLAPVQEGARFQISPHGLHVA